MCTVLREIIVIRFVKEYTLHKFPANLPRQSRNVRYKAIRSPSRASLRNGARCYSIYLLEFCNVSSERERSARAIAAPGQTPAGSGI